MGAAKTIAGKSREVPPLLPLPSLLKIKLLLTVSLNRKANFNFNGYEMELRARFSQLLDLMLVSSLACSIAASVAPTPKCLHMLD